jgi:hypothetical protein
MEGGCSLKSSEEAIFSKLIRCHEGIDVFHNVLGDCEILSEICLGL